MLDDVLCTISEYVKLASGDYKWWLYSNYGPIPVLPIGYKIALMIDLCSPLPSPNSFFLFPKSFYIVSMARSRFLTPKELIRPNIDEDSHDKLHVYNFCSP